MDFVLSYFYPLEFSKKKRKKKRNLDLFSLVNFVDWNYDGLFVLRHKGTCIITTNTTNWPREFGIP